MKQLKSNSMRNSKGVWKKVKKVFVIMFAILLVAMLAAIFIIGKMVNDGVLYQNEGNDTKKNSILQLEEWGYDRDAFHSKYNGVDFSIKSADGNDVPGTIYLSDEKNPWVIFVHGAGGDREFGIAYAEVYLQEGYNVLTFDERGHGDNSDQRVTFGICETHDVEALVDYLKSDYHAESIILHGQSMGGATAALYAASEHGNQNLDACILDCPVPGMKLFLKLMFMEDNCSEDTADAIVWCGELYSKLFSHLNYSDGDTIEKAKNIKVPTMVVVSKQDSVCLPEYVSQIYNQIPVSEKKLVEYDCEHIKGVFEYKEEYASEVSEFLDDILIK